MGSKNESDFNSKITEKLNGCSDKFVNFIKTLKPFEIRTDGSVETSLLFRLSKLHNLDKHNILIPTISVLELKNVKIENSNGSGLTIQTLRTEGNGTRNNGRIISVPIPGVKYSCDPNAKFSVCFSNTNIVDGSDIIEFLNSAEQSINNIINSVPDS